MKPKLSSGNLSLVIIVFTIVSFLIVISLMILGPVVGNVFSEINSSLSPSTTQEAIPTSPSIDAPNTGALLETRRLTLEFPPKIKAATASDILRLTLEVDGLGNIIPTAYYETNIVTGEVIQIPNLYETHNVGVKTRFDIAGVQVEPRGDIYQPLRQGESLTFYWSIRSEQVGKFRGTIWVYLVFADKATGEESQNPVSAQIIEIEAVDFFGFSVNFVRTSGVIGSVLGIIVGFPFFDDIVKYLWGRRKKKKKKVKSNK